MTKQNLKPCPFCGGDKLIICETDFGLEQQKVYAVSCLYSGCHGGIFALSYGNFETKDEAIAEWNTRDFAERDEALNQLDSSRHSVDVLEKRLTDKMAKLAKAVEALQEMLEDPEYWSPYARATLSELEKRE